MSSNHFEIEHFLSLSGESLIDYVEPFVTTGRFDVPDSVYNQLVATLGKLSDEHTVYALELCKLLKQSDFVEIAIDYLSHASANVCCTACRLIESLPLTMVSKESRRRISNVPIVAIYAINPRNSTLVCTGTNQSFIHLLVTKFNS